MEVVPMTVQGEQKLRKELVRLRRLRPQVSQAIAEARELGDLKENAEYHAAREEQGIYEAQIRDVEHKLSVAQVIDVKGMKNSGKVIFGSTVTLIDMDIGEKKTYQIVGDDEADIKLGLISVSSPVARGLVGKMEGDEVTITTPGGEKVLGIERVNYI